MVHNEGQISVALCVSTVESVDNSLESALLSVGPINMTTSVAMIESAMLTTCSIQLVQTYETQQ